MGSPIDRTAKSALDSNLVNGVTSDAPKVKSNNDVVYNYVDGLNNALTTHADAATLPHADSSVTGPKIRDGAVTTSKIADGAVTAAKLNGIVIGSSNLADGSITTAKMGLQAVNTAQIADGAVTTAKQADQSVTNAKIAPTAVTLDKMAVSSVGTTQLVNLSVTNEKVANGVLTADKFVSGALTNETENGLRITAVEVEQTDLTAQLADTTTELALKANKTYTDTQLSLKADQSALNTTNSNVTSNTTAIGAKADKTYVDTQISSVASGSPKGIYATLAALQTAFPTGNTNIYLVTADGNWYYWNGSAWTAGGVYQSTGVAKLGITNDKLAPDAVTIEKTNFMATGKNLFNKNTITTGYYINWANGNPVADANYFYGELIPVKPSTQYTRKFGSYHQNYYDASGVWISGSFNVGATITTPANAAYIRLNLTISNKDTEQLEEGAVSTSYEYFGLWFKYQKPYVSGSIPFTALEEKSKRGQYPFQPTATLSASGTDTTSQIKLYRGIKSITLFNPDPLKTYALFRVRRNGSAWQLTIREVVGQVMGIVVCDWLVSGYTEPTGFDRVILTEFSNGGTLSGVSAEILIDWTAFTLGDNLFDMFWNETGISPLAYDFQDKRIKVLESNDVSQGNRITTLETNQVSAASSKTFKKNTITLFGDSITARDSLDTATSKRTYAEGYFTWANVFLGQRFKVLNNAGVSGNTTTQMLARIQADVIDKNPSYCFVLGGINDIIQNVTSDAIIANLTSIYNQLLSKGIIVLASKIIPSTMITAGAFLNNVHLVNKFIEDFSFANDNFILIKLGKYFSDPETGEPYASMATDGTHPVKLGGYYLGKAIAEELQYIIPSRDDFGLSNAKKSTMNPNPMMTGNVSGLATSYSFVSNVNTVASKIARTDITGEYQRLAVSDTSSTTTTHFGLTSSMGSGVVAPGEQYFAQCEVSLSNIEKYRVVKLYLDVYDASNASVASTSALYSQDDLEVAMPNWSGVLKTLPITVPTTGVKLISRIEYNIKGILDVGRYEVKKA